MNTFNLKISSPDGNAFEGEAVKISLRGSEGDLAVMAGHISFLTAVLPCEVKVELPDETEWIGKTGEGLLSVGENKVTLLSGNIEVIS